MTNHAPEASKDQRTYTDARLDPVLTRYVPDGYRTGISSNTVNKPEAEAIVKTISDMVRDPAYSGRSIGVISLQASPWLVGEDHFDEGCQGLVPNRE